MERFVAVTALVIAGLDVLHVDADCVVLHDFRPFLATLKPIDISRCISETKTPSISRA